MPATTDAAALVDLVTEHNGQLRALALRLLDDPALVDDALQDAYIRAFRALPRFRGESSLATWLYRIVRNVCMDELRRRRRRAERPYEAAESMAVGDDSGDLTVERTDLVAGLAALPATHRAAIVLVDGYGMGYRAAGEMLGIPAGTVGSRVFRARASLRLALAVHAA